VTAAEPAAATAASDAVLALPVVDALAPQWRQLLATAAEADAAATGSAAAAANTGADTGADSGAPASLAQLREMLDALSRLSADGDVIVAALLHDLPHWRARVEPQLAKSWPTVATLLEGQRAAAQVWTLHAAQHNGRNAEGLRRLLLVMVKDLRVVPVLLARQLALLRSAGKRPEAERRALAQLTRDIHAPLANRLGIWQLKWELEDLAFRHLEPETYQKIARLLDEKRGDRERYIEQVKRELGAALKAQGVEAEVAGRPKHITSIWKKMQKKGVPIGELYDLRAVRVMVKDIPSCYAALGVTHALWAPISSEFDDYIARPKANDYRSLHTAVVGPEGKTLEVQIRTDDMHAQAELGVAAHWRYKEGRAAPADAGLDRKIEWMRRLLESGRDEQSADGGAGAQDNLSSAFDAELIEDRIYTLTPQGDVVDLPNGATPLDFAYHVHTMVGHRCRGAKVDGRIVPLDYKLRSGERVEILTAKTAEPRRDWLVVANGFLASSRSRDKVRAWFHKLDRARNLQAGREMLEKELRRLSLLNADLTPMLAKFHVESIDDLFVLVALGDAGPHQIGRALLDHERAQHDAAAQAADAGCGFGLHRRRRRQPAGADRALLPAAAGRTDRGLSHPQSRRQRASRRLRRVPAALGRAAAARAGSGMGPRRQQPYRSGVGGSARPALAAQGSQQPHRQGRCARAVDQYRSRRRRPRASALATARARPRAINATARADRADPGGGRRAPGLIEALPVGIICSRGLREGLVRRSLWKELVERACGRGFSPEALRTGLQLRDVCKSEPEPISKSKVRWIRSFCRHSGERRNLVFQRFCKKSGSRRSPGRRL
jgi:GTP pyrophosphokinase